jgi:hypothetical protein
VRISQPVHVHTGGTQSDIHTDTEIMAIPYAYMFPKKDSKVTVKKILSVGYQEI